MLKSHFEAFNIFSRILRVELERQIFHVFTDQRLYFAGLGFGQDVQVLWYLNYEVLVVF